MSTLDEIVTHIEREAAKIRNRNIRNAPQPVPTRRLVPTVERSAQVHWTPISTQLTFHIRADRRYHINELLGLHGEAFIRASYLAILGREPDAEGLQHHRHLLLSGVDKGVLLARIAMSNEGRGYAATIHGIAKYKVRLFAGLVPLLGTIVEWLHTFATLHRLPKRMNSIETHFTLQQQNLVSHLNAQFTSRRT
jgi:Domain of unknown function (DUF4214)